MKKILSLAFFVCSLLSCFGYGSQQGNYGSVGSGAGGTTINNVITNQTTGPILAFSGGSSNITAGFAGTPYFYPLSAQGSYLAGGGASAILSTNATPIPPGTYSYFQVYSPQSGTVITGTNYDFVLFTNNPSIAPVATLIHVLVTSSGTSQTFVITNTISIPSNTLASIGISNNMAATSSGLIAFWSMSEQVPTSIASVANTITTNVNVTNVLTGNTLWVDAINGNNSTAVRGNQALPYANPYAAVQAAQPGDTVIILPGTYQEGSNIMGQVPKNLSIIGLGQPTIVYTNYQSANLTAMSIYMQPNDNFKCSGLWFSTPVSNFDSAAFGNISNVVGTATNWHVNINCYSCDSDFIYLAATSLMNHCSFDGVIDHHYWDGFATAGTINTNDAISLNNCEFDCDYRNGINPSTRSGLNIAFGGGTYYLNNVVINMPYTNGLVISYGIRVGTLPIVYYNQVGFNDLPSTKASGSPNFADINYPAQFAAGGAVGIVYSLNTNSLVIANNGATTGFPQNLAGTPLYGALTVPFNISQDSANGIVYGSLNIYDYGTNSSFPDGAIVLTNVNNAAAANGGSAIIIRTESLNATIPQAGTLNLVDMTMPSTNVSFTIVNTNWVLGGKYSFPYAVQVSANAILTTAGVAGNCDLDLEVSGNTTNRIAIQTIVTSVASSYTNYIGAFIPANTTFDFTNRSSGAGDSAAVYGGQYIQY